MDKLRWSSGAGRLLLGCAVVLGLVSGAELAHSAGGLGVQTESFAEVVSAAGSVFACPRTVGCTTPAVKGARIFTSGEARTGVTGLTDLQSRTSVFRLQNNAVLQLQAVTNAIQRLVLKGGRLFVSHDPQGRDVITLEAGKKRVEAVDTEFTVEAVEQPRSTDLTVYVAIPVGGGSVTVTLESGVALQLAAGQQLTVPADAVTLPAPEPLDPAEQARWDQLVTAWQGIPDLTVPNAHQFVPLTGYTIADKFLAYWNAHDGPRRIGYPISEEFLAPSVIMPAAAVPRREISAFGSLAQAAPARFQAQCFERALLEFHPEYRGTDFGVLIALLGDYGYRARYGGTGAAGQVPNQAPGQSQYFPETGHWLGGRFRQYWLAHGGLIQHGYPLSDEFVEPSGLDPGQSYTVQYFERSLFEYHPEQAGTSYEVMQGQLGTYYCRDIGLPTPTPAPGAPATGTPTNTPTNMPTETPTTPPLPTQTPGGPTATPGPPSPTRTLPPTQTPGGPTATPVPTSTLTGTPTNTPTNTPTDTPTYTPTNTPPPTQTPGGFTATPVPPTATPAAVCAWREVLSPNVGTRNNTLYGVAMSGSTDGWVVGSYQDSNGINRTLTMRWNGASWNVVPSPNLGAGHNVLRAVTALAPNDVWAVGDACAVCGSGQQMLILHWDGASWSVVTSPNPSPGRNTLTGVSALAANNVWAVGYYDSTVGQLPLVAHWDGASWSVVAVPSMMSSDNNLHAVDTLAGQVWAIGNYVDPSENTYTFGLHYAGTWTVAPTADPPGAPYSTLDGVAALALNDIWAVGSYFSAVRERTLIQHSDGATWSIVASPNVGTEDNNLRAVAGVGAADVWAVGDVASGNTRQTLILQWDGASWTVVSSPSPAPLSNILRAVAARTATDLWAVGGQTYVGTSETLALRYSCVAASPTPTPTP